MSAEDQGAGGRTIDECPCETDCRCEEIYVLKRRQEETRSVVLTTLKNNGGPIDGYVHKDPFSPGTWTKDAYVLVRRQDFDALESMSKPGAEPQPACAWSDVVEAMRWVKDGAPCGYCGKVMTLAIYLYDGLMALMGEKL